MLTNYFRVTDVQLRTWCDSIPVLTKDFDLDQIPCEEHLDLSSQTNDLIGWLISAYCRCVESQKSAAISVAFGENRSDEDKLRDILQIAKADVPGSKSADLLGRVIGGHAESDEWEERIDYGLGAARVFQPETVRNAVSELARFSIKTLRKQYLAEKPSTDKHLMLLGLGQDREFFDEYVVANFERLKAFLGRAASSGQTVVMVNTD